MVSKRTTDCWSSLRKRALFALVLLGSLFIWIVTPYSNFILRKAYLGQRNS